jgi:putative transposase
MEAYKCGSLTVWNSKYIWSGAKIPAGRCLVVRSRYRELLREMARPHEMAVHDGSINRDHVHMLMSIPPNLSVSRAVQHLKGRSSNKLLSEFGILRKHYWGQHLWTRYGLNASRTRRCLSLTTTSTSREFMPAPTLVFSASSA